MVLYRLKQRSAEKAGFGFLKQKINKFIVWQTLLFPDARLLPASNLQTSTPSKVTFARP